MSDEYTCNYGSKLLRKHTLALLQEVEGVRLAEDIECIHRMRVASRRLRAALPLFRDCYPEKKWSAFSTQIRQITRSLGAARDTDVQIDKLKQALSSLPEKRFAPGIRRLILRLSQRRAKLQTKVNRTLERLTKSGIVDEMLSAFETIASSTAETPPISALFYRRSYEAISRCLEAFLCYETHLFDPLRVEELHAMRIAAKHLRYTMEIFAPSYPDELKTPLQIIRKTQEALGLIHDCDVWEMFLTEFIEDERQRVVAFYGKSAPFNLLLPGLEYFRTARLEERKLTYENFLQDWKSWKKQNVWENLLFTVQKPVSFLEQPLYPSIDNSP